MLSNHFGPNSSQESPNKSGTLLQESNPPFPPGTDGNSMLVRWLFFARQKDYS